MLTASAFKEPFSYLDRDDGVEEAQRYKEDMEDANRESAHFRVSQIRWFGGSHYSSKTQNMLNILEIVLCKLM